MYAYDLDELVMIYIQGLFVLFIDLEIRLVKEILL